MKRTTVVIIVALTLLILLVVVYFIIQSLLAPSIDSGNSVDSNGLNASQKREAIDLALASPYGRDILVRNPGRCAVRNVSPMGDEWFAGSTGYLNSTDSFAQVPISVGGEGMFSMHYLIGVDLTAGRVLSQEAADYRRTPMGADVVIPQGAIWYQRILWVGDEVRLNLTQAPGDSDVSLIVVNSTNMKKIEEGSPFDPLIFYNRLTNRTEMQAGAIDRTAGWQAFISDTPLETDYVVVMNPGPSDAAISFEMY